MYVDIASSLSAVESGPGGAARSTVAFAQTAPSLFHGFVNRWIDRGAPFQLRNIDGTAMGQCCVQAGRWWLESVHQREDSEAGEDGQRYSDGFRRLFNEGIPG